MPDQYTVVLRGEAFTLYRDQLQTDSPNYFTELFLGDFEESRTHKVELSRSPQLFRAVVEYMSGYSILPLAPAIIPPAMTAATALENLLRDAEYYGLDGLVHLTRMRPRAVPAPTEAYRALDIAPREALSFQNIMTMGKDPSEVVFEPDHGIGTLVDGQWKRILICKDVKIMFEDFELRPMFTTTEQAKLKERGMLASQEWWNGPIYHDGTQYALPKWVQYDFKAPIKVNGHAVAPNSINRMCAHIAFPHNTVIFPPFNKAELVADDDKAVFEDLKRTLTEGKAWNDSRIVLWCSKLMFTVARSSIRIVEADCVTREDFVSQLIASDLSLSA